MHAYARMVYPLLTVDEGDERRTVGAAFDDEGNLLLGEENEGETTLFAYGVPHHYHQIALAPASLAPLMDVLASSDGRCKGEHGGNLDALLQNFFGLPNRFLSDLMDALDAAEVPYAYYRDGGVSNVSYRPVQHPVQRARDAGDACEWRTRGCRLPRIEDDEIDVDANPQ